MKIISMKWLGGLQVGELKRNFLVLDSKKNYMHNTSKNTRRWYFFIFAIKFLSSSYISINTITLHKKANKNSNR